MRERREEEGDEGLDMRKAEGGVVTLSKGETERVTLYPLPIKGNWIEGCRHLISLFVSVAVPEQK
jgi:hypothetical protein